jgi:hypothetical protein
LSISVICFPMTAALLSLFGVTKYH